MYKPSAGSGGGGGGGYNVANNGYTYYDGGGGGGGSGGGFVDITAGGSIYIYGELNASGGRGGNAAAAGYGYYGGGGGGGGGSGGGIRLLTPNDIDINGGMITAAGGNGGNGVIGTGVSGTPNTGGAGGLGRIVMEDSDSVISGYPTATVVPSEGQDGFYRGTFEASRFQGGGLNATAVTGVMFLGPISPPFYATPVLSDFVIGIPATANRGIGQTSMLVEAQGYPLRADGTPDLNAGSGWYTVGYFAPGVAGPAWSAGVQPPPDADFQVPPTDNVGVGIQNLNGLGYLQLRINFYMPDTITATEPGPYMDRWAVRFSCDQ